MDMALNQPQHPLLIDTVMVNTLSYLPQKDFLSSRLVCPNWDVNCRHLIKNDICGFDFCIKMIDPELSASAVNGPRFSQFNSIFENDPDGKKMVYSKFEIPDFVFSNDFQKLWQLKIPFLPLALEPSVGKFFQKFGDKIKSVNLLLSHGINLPKDYEYKNLENAARLMPNLETIEFGNYHNLSRIVPLEIPREGTSDIPPAQSPRNIRTAKFNNATRMKIRGGHFSYFKLKNIPEYFPNIHWLSIVNPSDRIESILEKSFNYYWSNTPQIPCHIDTLIIENNCNQDLVVLKRLTKECGLKLKCFNGNSTFPDFEIELHKNFYDFISLQKDSLERLDFKITRWALRKSYPLNWPSDSIIFPRLTSLGIRGEFIQEICKGREFHKVFPSVEKIQLELPFIRKSQRDFNFGDLFNSLTPSRVRVLEISLNGEPSHRDQFGKMAQYFPNVQELSLIINSYNWDSYLTTLVEMEDWMGKIKVLKISILRNDKFPTQIDGCLLDLSESRIMKKFVQYMGSNLEEEEKEKEILGIANFSSLTRLELSGPITITDISIYLGFGRMRALKHIVINPPAKVELTSKCEEYIKKKRFQILLNQEPEIVPNLLDEIFDSSDEDEDFEPEAWPNEEEESEEEEDSEEDSDSDSEEDH